MILSSLQLQNYKQYASLDLEFREGLVGIIGKNGAGKSTIFEAILYCLYGKDELNKELIRSSFAEPKAPVRLTLEFSIGPALYRLIRELRGRRLDTVNAELYKNDEQIAKGASAVNQEVVKLLQLDREAFRRSVFSGQKELTQLSDTTGQSRTLMVRKMLGLDSLDVLQKNVSNDAKNIRNQIKGQEGFLLSEEEIKALNAEIKSLQKEESKETKSLKKEEKTLSGLEKEQETLKGKFEEESKKQQAFNRARQLSGTLEERYSGLEKQLSTASGRQEELLQKQQEIGRQKPFMDSFQQGESELRQLEKHREKHINLQARRKEESEAREPLSELGSRVNKLKKQIEPKSTFEKEMEETRARLETCNSQLENKREELRNVEKQISSLEQRIADRAEKKKQLEEIGKQGTCPTCFQPVLDAYDNVLEQLSAEIKGLEAKEKADLLEQQEIITRSGLELKSNYESLQKQVQTLQSGLNEIKSIEALLRSEQNQYSQLESKLHRIQVLIEQIGEVKFDEKAFSALKTRLDSERAQFLELQKEESYLNRELPEIKHNLELLKDQLNETRQKKLEAEKALKEVRYDEVLFTQTKEAFLNSDKAATLQRKKVQELHTAILKIQHQQEKTKDRLLNHEKVLEAIQSNRESMELLDKLVEQIKQFKTELLDRVSPGISREASKLFSRITKGKYENIRVDEHFEFSIADGGVYYPIERFSGGEIDLANFCLRIAITRAIMDLNGTEQSLEFLAFDEIFGSQDEERRHEIMMALNFLQEQFKQIYIVSHIETQKDYFPNILEVKQLEEGSDVRWI